MPLNNEIYVYKYDNNYSLIIFLGAVLGTWHKFVINGIVILHYRYLLP